MEGRRAREGVKEREGGREGGRGTYVLSRAEDGDALRDVEIASGLVDPQVPPLGAAGHLGREGRREGRRGGGKEGGSNLSVLDPNLSAWPFTIFLSFFPFLRPSLPPHSPSKVGQHKQTKCPLSVPPSLPPSVPTPSPSNLTEGSGCKPRTQATLFR